MRPLIEHRKHRFESHCIITPLLMTKGYKYYNFPSSKQRSYYHQNQNRVVVPPSVSSSDAALGGPETGPVCGHRQQRQETLGTRAGNEPSRSFTVPGEGPSLLKVPSLQLLKRHCKNFAKVRCQLYSVPSRPRPPVVSVNSDALLAAAPGAGAGPGRAQGRGRRAAV